MLQSKQHITACIKLFRQHSWLLDRSDAFDFLQRECASEAELQLLFELLGRFSYLEQRDIDLGFEAMIDQIVSGWALNGLGTFMCPPKVDSSADSGPAVIQMLKKILGQRRIKGFELAIRATKLKDIHGKINTIVITDDFAGTGKTIEDKLAIVKNYYKEAPPRIYVCLLAASKIARELLEPQVDGYFAWKEFNRGITDHYPEATLSAAISAMQDLESRLHPNIDGITLPKFGYGGTEVLMGWDNNLPNSVFPIFWWPESVNSGARTTLFDRHF